MGHDDAYRQTLAALREELRQVDQQRHKLVHAIAAIEDLLSPKKGSVQTGMDAVLVPHDTAEANNDSPSYPDAVQQTLEGANKPLHIMDIVARMQARGWYRDKPKKRLRNSVVGTLERKVRNGDTFTKTAPATFGLKRWEVDPKPTE